MFRARSLFRLALLLALLTPGTSLAQSWSQSSESDGIAYFLDPTDQEIHRYDLDAAVWMASLLLNDTPTAFTVDTSGIYVAFGSRTSRLTLDGTTETPLVNTSGTVAGAVTDGNLLLLVAGSTLWVVDKTSGDLLDSQNYFYRMQGISVSRSLNRVFGRSTGVSPSDIVGVTYDDSGNLVSQNDSPHHGAYPGAVRTWVFPDDARVIDSAGIVYLANSLDFAAGIGGAIDSIAFYGSLPIALRGSTLHAYSNGLQETGQYTLAQQAHEVFVRGDDVFAFYDGPSGIAVEIVPTSSFGPLLPDEPIDPEGLPFTPDEVIHGQDGIVYLLSRQHVSVFRWSTQSRSYLSAIPLVEAPLYMALSDVNKRLYFAYPSGRLGQLDTEDTQAGEQPFGFSPQRPCGLQTAGDLLVVCDPSGAWVSHFVWSAQGVILDQEEWNRSSRVYTWNSVLRRLYFFRDGTSPNDLHYEEILEDGTIGAEGETPAHGGVGTIPPIRVSPDGSVVILGSGEVYDAASLNQINNLPNAIDDVAWLDGTPFTIRYHNGVTQIQEWDGSYFEVDRFGALGTPIRILPLVDELLILTLDDEGIPTWWVKSPGDMDLDEDGLDDSADNCPAVPNPEQQDVNGDGIGDHCQPNDTDGDGWPDNRDNCPQTPNSDQGDLDGDGLGDACEPPDWDGDNVGDADDNCPLIPNADQADADWDGTGDACESDTDADGVIDDDDNCILVQNADQADSDGDGIGDACTPPDLDFDGVDNAPDNCPHVYNPAQSDADGDGIGDSCEPDSDWDGAIDDVDNCPFVWNPNQEDTNDDGYGDACQPSDSDWDGWLDPEDNCPNAFNPAQVDSDGDGRGDACEPDWDLDLVIDDIDNCPYAHNRDQSDLNGDGIGDVCQTDDSDGDGWPDAEDACVERPNPLQRDSDADGFGNPCDCDFDQDQACGLIDFFLWLQDFIAGGDSGIGTDMDGDGSVGLGDFGLFLSTFQAGVPGPSGLAP